ncbi:unnamed protein product [Ectocarpus fasciculatus]
MKVDIKELIRLEAELKKSCDSSATPPVVRDAKVNMLKYLQIQTVLQFEAAYDTLYYELDKEGGLECLRSIVPFRSKDFFQPKVFESHGCGDEDVRLAKQLDFYLADAELAKQRLDEIITNVADDWGRYEVQYVEVKSRESTSRKVRRFYDGNVRKVADMARVTVICLTPEDLQQVYSDIIGSMDVRRVTNGFNNDWMPSGYRDVKVNPVVNDHLCEIQLHLGDFSVLKSDQHAVYEWARDLRVTTKMRATDLFSTLSSEVTEEMIRLARQDWCGTGYSLPELLLASGQYDQAEEGLRQQLSEAENDKQGVEDDDSNESRRALLGVNTARSNLGSVLREQGKYIEADRLCLGDIEMGEDTLGPDHPDVAIRLNNRAELLRAQGNFDEAEPLYVRAIAIGEKVLGKEHPDLATWLNNLAGLLHKQGRFNEAEPLFERCLAIREKALGLRHPAVATVLNCQAGLLTAQGKYYEAGRLYMRSLAIREEALGPDHPAVAAVLNNRADLLTKQVRIAKYQASTGCLFVDVCRCCRAETCTSRSEEMFRMFLVIFHSSCWPLQRCIKDTSQHVVLQGKFVDAVSLNERATEIWTAALGPEHPTVAVALNNRARLMECQGKYAEAEPLYEQCQAIEEKVLGSEHPSLATTLNNRAGLLYKQGKHKEAVPFLERASFILRKKLGESHHSTVANQKSLECLRKLVREREPSSSCHET